MTTRFREHKDLAAIVFLFWICGLLYDSATPIFEGLDEVWHYALVHHLADGAALPVVEHGVDSPWRQEGTHPPLYYVILASATAWIDRDDYQSHRVLSSHNLSIGLPHDAQGEKFWYYHTRAEDFPYHRTTLAVHLGRWLSLLMATVTIMLTYATALELLPNHTPVASLAAVIVAFNPGFIFIGAQINNDNLCNLLGTAALYLLARLWQRGFSLRLSTGLGFICGLLALTKLNGLLILPVIAIVGFVCAAKYRAWKEFITLGFMCVSLTMLSAGWWYWRNFQLYGDPFAMEIRQSFTTTRSLTYWQVLQEYWGFHISYWGVFGLSNIVLPNWTYQVYAVLTWLSISGLTMSAWKFRKGALRALVLPLIHGSIVLLGTLDVMRIFSGPGARYTYIAIGAYSLLAAIGLLAIVPHRWHRQTAVVLATGMAIIAFGAPYAVIRPVYARALSRPPLAREGITVQYPLQAYLGDVVKLHGFDVARTATNDMQVTLHWEVLERTEENLIVFVHLFDAQDEFIAGQDSVPMDRTYPSTVWSPGEWLADTHILNVSHGIDPGEYRLVAGMYRFSDNLRLPVGDINGLRFADDVIPLGQTIAFPP